LARLDAAAEALARASASAAAREEAAVRQIPWPGERYAESIGDLVNRSIAIVPGQQQQHNHNQKPKQPAGHRRTPAWQHVYK
jgi:hypothetical protein